MDENTQVWTVLIAGKEATASITAKKVAYTWDRETELEIWVTAKIEVDGNEITVYTYTTNIKTRNYNIPKIVEEANRLEERFLEEIEQAKTKILQYAGAINGLVDKGWEIQF